MRSQYPWGWSAGDSEPLPLQENIGYSVLKQGSRLAPLPPPICKITHCMHPRPGQDCVTVTGGCNTVKTDEGIETGSSATENPFQAKRHETSRAHRVQTRVQEGREPVRVCVAKCIPFLCCPAIYCLPLPFWILSSPIMVPAL